MTKNKKQVRTVSVSEIKIDRLVKSKRKTIGLQIDESGSLVVRAPIFVTEKQIQKFVNQSQDWILKTKEKIQKKKAEAPKKKFENGELFFFLGDYFRLELVEKQKGSLTFDGRFFLAENKRKNGKEIFEKWYRKEAKKIIFERVLHFAEKEGLKFKSIKITGARRRYGSCTSRGNLNFAWRLVLAPIEALDYVVVHELCHLRQMNHSRKFWAEVESLLPDYRTWRKWFKDNGHLLEV